MAERPQTSSVAEAMQAAAAVEEILSNLPFDAPEIATYLGTIVTATRSLSGYQVEDFLEHIHYRAGRIEALYADATEKRGEEPIATRDQPVDLTRLEDADPVDHDAAAAAAELRDRVHGDT